MSESTKKNTTIEYTKQVADLYAKLSIDSSKSMSIEEISQEYKRNINTLTSETVLFSNYYLTK